MRKWYKERTVPKRQTHQQFTVGYNIKIVYKGNKVLGYGTKFPGRGSWQVQHSCELGH